MLKKKPNISELLDKKEEQDAKELEEYEKKYDARAKKVETTIVEQFNIAKSILGHRLKMEKQHEKMYYFYFNSGVCGSSYIHTCEEFNTNIIFKFTPSQVDYCKKLKELSEKEIKLSELADILVRWVEIITESRLKEK